MAASRGRMVTFLFMVASLILSSSAASYNVGDSAGWVVPQNALFYDDWAANQNFVVGDKLVFVSSTSHNVYEVSATDADACDASNPLAIYLSTSPTVTLSSAGTHAFICESPGHCRQGMKMIVDVVTRLGNDTSSPTTRPVGKGPLAAPLLNSPPAPSSAFGLRSSLLLYIVGAALAVIAPWLMTDSECRGQFSR